MKMPEPMSATRALNKVIDSMFFAMEVGDAPLAQVNLDMINNLYDTNFPIDNTGQMEEILSVARTIEDPGVFLDEFMAAVRQARDGQDPRGMLKKGQVIGLFEIFGGVDA